MGLKGRERPFCVKTLTKLLCNFSGLIFTACSLLGGPPRKARFFAVSPQKMRTNDYGFHFGTGSNSKNRLRALDISLF
jgi:hypothetical protein